VGMGAAPDAIMAAGLGEALSQAGINIASQHRIEIEWEGEDPLGPILQINRAVAEAVSQAAAIGLLPVILGGDCMLALGIIAGLAAARPGQKLGVAWFDAHGDFNTPEISETGFLPGMPLACLTGHGLQDLRKNLDIETLDENHVILLGVRDLDPQEKELLEATPISYLSPADVEKEHTQVVAEHHFRNVAGLYLHLDVDVLDPSAMPGTDYRTPKGLSPETMHAAIQSVKAVQPIVAIALTGLNPEVERTQSVDTAIQLLTTAVHD